MYTPTHTFKRLYALLLALFLGASGSFAQTAWTGNVDNSWGTAGNWTNGVPTGPTAITLGDNAPNTAQTINLDGDRTITTGGSILLSSTGTEITRWKVAC